VGITSVDGPRREGPFAFAHHPVQVEGAYVLAGHLHPCITLRGKGRQHERLPCFWMGWGVGVLPAFGEFTGCSPVRPVEGDRVYVMADGEVVEVGLGGERKVRGEP
jgi:metallophosphoesterase superfamily enzyme